jgi:hypothetical protein
VGLSNLQQRMLAEQMMRNNETIEVRTRRGDVKRGKVVYVSDYIFGVKDAPPWYADVFFPDEDNIAEIMQDILPGKKL